MTTHLSNSDRIAMCKACTIAEVMKTCKLCAFQIGLQAKQEEIRTIELKSWVLGTLGED